MEAGEEISNLAVAEEQNLEDVIEDPESGDSETANEVEVSEKALKFKIATEGNVGGGRKSYPGSRKGSRERVHNFNSSDLNRVIQKGKLKTGALSFDQRCLVGKKLSFDNPEFLDEYAIIFNKRFDAVDDPSTDLNRDHYKFNKDECVLSKETLNLNKRNSEHSVKSSLNLDEKRSILKCPEKTKNQNLVASAGDQKYINSESVSNEEIAKPQESESQPSEHRKNSIFKTVARHASLTKNIDNTDSISVEKPDLNLSQVQSDTDTTNIDNKNKSILSRLRQFTDRFSLSLDKESKVKNSKSAVVKNNNSTKSLVRGRKKIDSPCCNSMENGDDRRASTLPKTKKANLTKRGWKFLVLGKDKTSNNLETWASDADVKLSTLNADSDNQSLPSTSHSQNNCTSRNPKPEIKREFKTELSSGDVKIEEIQGNKVTEPINQQVITTAELSKLQELRVDQVLMACEQNNSTLI